MTERLHIYIYMYTHTHTHTHTDYFSATKRNEIMPTWVDLKIVILSEYI